jgi:hypothetical protein
VGDGIWGGDFVSKMVAIPKNLFTGGRETICHGERTPGWIKIVTDLGCKNAVKYYIKRV